MTTFAKVRVAEPGKPGDAGYFAIGLIIRKPLCAVGTPAKVRKVVVKMLVG